MSSFPVPIGVSRRLPALLIVSGVLLSGCATPQNPDPIESVNRKTFALNEGIDKVVLKPVATVYKTVVPTPVRGGVTNFFSNLGDPWSGANLLLQGRFKDGMSDFARFGTNTTVGLLGFMDVATGWGMPRHGDGFSDTLGVWGVGGGAYLVLPLFRTVRPARHRVHSHQQRRQPDRAVGRRRRAQRAHHRQHGRQARQSARRDEDGRRCGARQVPVREGCLSAAADAAGGGSVEPAACRKRCAEARGGGA